MLFRFELVVFPLSIFRRIVPVLIQDWIGDDKVLLAEIHGILSGDPAAREGPVGMLVARAVTEFTHRHNSIAANPSVTINTGIEVAEPTSAVAPIPPAVTMPVAVDPGTGIEGPRLACQFMRWVASGITDRSIRINDAAALVHFVEEGMLLVSPRVFREFARQFGEDGVGAVPSRKVDESRLGISVQSKLLQAGWHQPTLNGNNIQKYDVVKHRRLVSKIGRAHV